MGAVLSGCAACTPSDVIADEDAETLPSLNGARMTYHAKERESQQIERSALQDVSERESLCGTLRDDIRRLEATALDCRNTLRRAPRGSRDYIQAANTAREVLAAAMEKKNELAYHRKILAITNTSLQQKRKRVQQLKDRVVLGNLHRYVKNIDVEQDDEGAEDIAKTAQELTDMTHELQNTQNDTYATLDAIDVTQDSANPIMAIGDKFVSLGDDGDLLSALDMLDGGFEAGQPDVQQAAASMPYMPATPQSDFADTNVSYARDATIPTTGLNARQKRTVGVEDMFSVVF